MRLTVVEEGIRTELDLAGPVITVGRALDNDIRLANTRVSRHHSRIEARGDQAWVIDLGSANGTLVNGERVTRKLLAGGDEIQLCGTRLLVAGEQREEVEVSQETIAVPGQAMSETGMKTLSGDARRERENLRVFAKITRELVRETDLLPLLRLIVDSAVALVGGERGFLMLRDHTRDAGDQKGVPDVEKMTVSVARSFDHSDVVVPRSRLSMGIAGKVVALGKPVLSLDAAQDERFEHMASVEDLRLRSVMCLPIEYDGAVEGVIYVDNRLQFGAFNEEDMELVELFAGQASIAIRNARFVAELRERNHRLEASRRQIERLNEQLGRKVRDRDNELAVVRAELGRERGRYDYTSIVGASDSMRKVFQDLDRIIESALPVLIHGESGTGKELIARAIHYNGIRKDKPFITENCAALPDTLLESELFGHVRGAFTGAYKSKKGLLEQADSGTLFLDEIGDMSPEMQKKLLRVLQEGEFRMLGSDRRVKIDVRILAASHRDLEELVRTGEFREDLYYRIAVLSVRLPPLRERRDDIPLLAETLLARAAREAGREVPALPHEVIAALTTHNWPGNVRELENEMRRLTVLAREIVGLDDLSEAVREGRSATGAPHAGPSVVESGDIRTAVAELERRSIEAALAQAGGNKSRAAAGLGISRFALQRKLEKYGLVKKRPSRAGTPTEEPDSSDRTRVTERPRVPKSDKDSDVVEELTKPPKVPARPPGEAGDELE
ncbi:MAG: transcriptional regulator with GAF, ATPase, and Fis domain [Planctomycetota bacterium]|jgi:transcriptional regulator with GAF, ATPase, and Fis domain